MKLHCLENRKNRRLYLGVLTLGVFLLFSPSQVSLSAQEESSVRWEANVVSEKDIPEELHMVPGAKEIKGEDWKLGETIGICRFLSAEQSWHVGQWLPEKDECVAVIPIEDRQADRESSSSHQLFTQLRSSNYEVLLAESKEDYLWDLAGEEKEGFEEFLLNPSNPGKKVNRICRGMNITRATTFRGKHVGQVGVYDSAYYCFYRMGDRGFRYPSWYIENKATREAISLVKRLNEQQEPLEDYEVLFVRTSS